MPPRPRSDQLAPELSRRNRRDRAIELATALVDQADYGLRVFAPAATPPLPVHVVDNRVTDEASGKPTFELFAHPVPGTQSLFLLEHATSRKEVITTDMYLFFAKEKLNWIIPDVYPHADDYNAVGYNLRRQTG